MSNSVPPKKRELLDPDDIVKDLRDLPSAPAVLPKLLTILNDASASMWDVIALVKIEPGIAARVLQLANSAYYSKGGRCTSIDEGVNRVGFLKIYEVVAYAVSSQLLMRNLAAYGIEAEELWRRSVGCAIGSAILAPVCELDTDVAYTIGLFHAVGLVAIDSWLKADESPVTLESAGLPQETTGAEKRAIGFGNGSIGAALLKNWSFRPNICDAVRWQYAPQSAGINRKAASLLHVSKWLQAAALSADPARRPALPDASILAELHLEKNDIEDRCAEVREEFNRASLMLAGP